MYSCIKCGALYEPDGKTQYYPDPGEPIAVFAMIWDCPECVKKEKFEKRRQTLD